MVLRRAVGSHVSRAPCVVPGEKNSLGQTGRFLRLARLAAILNQTKRHSCEGGVFPSTKAKKPEFRKTLGLLE